MAEQLRHNAWLALVLLVAGGCSTLGAPRPAPPTAEEVVRLSREGVGADEIIRRMDQSGAVYRLPVSQLANLRNQGVPDSVIGYMNQTDIEAARREEAFFQANRYMRYDPPFYRTYPYWYPFWPWHRLDQNPTGGSFP
jgi:hypothetical protein